MNTWHVYKVHVSPTLSKSFALQHFKHGNTNNVRFHSNIYNLAECTHACIFTCESVLARNIIPLHSLIMLPCLKCCIAKLQLRVCWAMCFTDASDVYSWILGGSCMVGGFSLGQEWRSTSVKLRPLTPPTSWVESGRGYAYQLLKISDALLWTKWCDWNAPWN